VETNKASGADNQQERLDNVTPEQKRQELMELRTEHPDIAEAVIIYTNARPGEFVLTADQVATIANLMLPQDLGGLGFIKDQIYTLGKGLSELK